MLFRRVLCVFCVIVAVTLSHLSCNLPEVSQEDIDGIASELESNKYDHILDSNFEK